MTTTTTEVAHALVRAIREAQRDDDPPFVQLGRVITVTPLTVAFDSATDRSVGQPVALAAGSAVSAADQVLVLWLADSHAYICIGKVT